MSVIRKTVRFHKGNAADMEVLDAVCRFKEYGFRSESQMIMEALRCFLSGTVSNCSPDELADLIADRILPRMSMPAPMPPSDGQDDQSSEDAVYDAALSFLDTL